MPKRLYLLSFLLIFGACARVTYVPTQVATPLLREKNDMRFSLSPDDASAAWAFADRWGVYANGQVTTRWLQRLMQTSEPAPSMPISFEPTYREPHIEIDDQTRGGQLEVGIGYFFPLKLRSSNRWRAEFYGGYSYGGYRSLDSNFTPHPLTPFRKSDFRISNQFHRFFVQGSLVKTGRISDVVFSTRFSFVNFHDMQSGVWSWLGRPENRGRFHRLDGRVYPIFEPAVTQMIGKGRLQFFYQVRLAVNPAHGYGDDDPEKKGPPEMLQASSINIGMVYRTGKWLQRRKWQDLLQE